MSARSQSAHSSSSPEPARIDRGQTVESDMSRSKRRKVSRSRAGCLTCRKRRKLCDMARPVCNACERLEMECTWPQNEPGEASRSVPPRKLSEIPHELRQPAAPHQQHQLYGMQQQQHANSAPPVLPAGQQAHQAFMPPTPKATVDDLMQIFGTSGDVNDPTAVPAAPPPPPPMAFAQPTLDPFRSMNSFNPAMMPGVGAGDFNTLFPDSFNFDESTLQLWAADCLPMASTAMAANPFDSLFQVLARQNNPVDTNFNPPPPDPISVVPTTASSTPLRTSEPTNPHHVPLMKHYRESLSALVAVPDKQISSPDAFDAFTKLASLHASSLEGHGLQLSILAWAGSHMVNQGKPRYEVVAEKLAARAQEITMDKCRDSRQSPSTIITEGERMTLIGSILMLWSYKICRGDVWGFAEMREHLAWLAEPIYKRDRGTYELDSVQRCFLENILGVDVLSSFSFLVKPVIPLDYILFCCNSLQGETVDSSILLIITKRLSWIAQLVRRRRALSRPNSATQTSTNGTPAHASETDELADIALKADELVQELKDEGRRAATLFAGSEHAKLATMFRLTCLMSIHSFIYLEAPTSVQLRLLVSQNIELLEQLAAEKTTGWAFCHEGLFVSALCALPSPAGQGAGSAAGTGPSQRDRLERLFDLQLEEMGHRNVTKSWKIVQEVWNRNQEGRVYVDWLDIIVDWDWELVLA